MKILKLKQGLAEWHRHRSESWNASDLPVIMGVSPYRKRADWIRERATGIAMEIDAATQRRFDYGHMAERLCRPLAEMILGEDLFPCVGVANDSKLSASFDGITMLGDVVWEHKLLASRLREAMFNGCTGADLPDDYRAQMEQQLMVSGAGKALFMASAWGEDGEIIEQRHCWYESDPELRAKIVPAWEQAEADTAAYQPTEQPATATQGAAPQNLQSLSVQVEGKVLASNLDAYRDHAMEVLGSINRDLQTDQDFSDAEETVKWCKSVEDKLSAAKDNVIGQMATVDQVCRTIDDLSAETRRIRLELDKLVKTEKESRKREILQQYADQVRAHYDAINKTMGEHSLHAPQSLTIDLAAAIKGKRTLGSITDAADQCAADAKIAASQRAERVRSCIAVLKEFADHSHLFADRVQICSAMQPDDLRNMARVRVSENQERERAKAEADREPIRAEEQAKAERGSDRARAKTPQEPVQEQAKPEAQLKQEAGAIRLGDINTAIAPLSITAAGLEQLGFTATKDGAAKTYNATDWPAIKAAMTRVIQSATEMEKAA